MMKTILREIYFNKDFKSAVDLTDYMSECHLKNSPCHKTHFDAYSCTRQELNFLAGEAEDLFGADGIQEFYRKSVPHYRKEFDSFKS
ncbi:hypothetical protein HYS72_02885 [Candidatus Pacearchaeota archaeon]|nr:hypothetical protein [Candidatus Pacearchaeota archaeon]